MSDTLTSVYLLVMTVPKGYPSNTHNCLNCMYFVNDHVPYIMGDQFTIDSNNIFLQEIFSENLGMVVL